MVFILSYEKPSLLQERFKKTTEKKDSFFKNVINNLNELIKPLSKKNIKTTEYINKSKKLLLQAGYASSEEDVLKYDTKKLLNLLVASGLMFLLLIISFSINTIAIAILTLLIAYKLPEMKLKKEIKIRQKEFLRFLPDAIDLLAICVQAGLSLDAAFTKIAEEFKHTSKIISIEFNRLNQDILSGLSKEESYKNLTLRIDSPDLKSFVALLIQSDKLGTSISQSLDAFCDSMRTKKRQRIEELSQQASTKMTIPMVLCMLPSIFLIIMYPALQKIMQNMGN